MEVTLLTDKSRLQEIYDLRVNAYEASPYHKYINRQNYPQGYSDELDPLDSTFHWIVEDNNKIIGSVRAALIHNLKMLEEDISQLNFQAETPFAYCGRTAVHPNYRSGKVMLLLDHAIKSFIAENTTIKFALCFVIPERVNAVKRLAFHSVGIIEYHWGNDTVSPLEAFIFEKQESNTIKEHIRHH